SRWADALHVFVLVGFSVAQPIYDRLRDHSAFLLDLRVGLPMMCVLIAGLSLVLPLMLVLVERLLGWSGEKVYNRIHLTLVFVLLLLLALPVAKNLDLFGGVLVLSLATVSAAVATWCYAYVPNIRNVCTLASPGIVPFPAIFLFQMHNGMSAALPA